MICVVDRQRFGDRELAGFGRLIFETIVAELTVEAGRLVIAIHPQTPRTPVPGTKGSVTLGLVVDEPIDTVLSRLAQRGVRTAGRSEANRTVSNRAVDIEDLDGNVITLWEAHAVAAEGELASSASTRG